ncbi:MAG: hypothetical protein AUI15_06370 [Actinobacteria bacterium 13_2_20CM_2_66_6]|nr:MAG: hypothetical protein AUI15_06370 [Actinobacteria bacterium 13_2_20CM_2_66_6]
MKAPLAVEAIGLERTYASGHTRVAALDGVTLGIRRGEFVAVVGMVFQAFNLLPRFRVVENVALPLAFSGVPASERLRRARAMLERLGMSARADHRSNELSGGELQRAAVARALIGDPAILLADEPTGNLDSANGAALLGLFEELHAHGQTVLLVTHDAQIASHADRTVRMRDGRVVDA